MPKTPTAPFEVDYTQSRPGDKQLPPQWAIPFDIEFRPVETPNGPADSFPAYASIGWHVVRNAIRYCPAYRVLETFNLRRQNSPQMVADWENKTHGHLTVTDRRTGLVYWLASSVSDTEAVISWFTRDSGHDGAILCHDRKDGIWYMELQRPELQVSLGADGTEVASTEEGAVSHYLVDKHPNAVMIHGE